MLAYSVAALALGAALIAGGELARTHALRFVAALCITLGGAGLGVAAASCDARAPRLRSIAAACGRITALLAAVALAAPFVAALALLLAAAASHAALAALLVAASLLSAALVAIAVGLRAITGGASTRPEAGAR